MKPTILGPAFVLCSFAACAISGPAPKKEEGTGGSGGATAATSDASTTAGDSSTTATTDAATTSGSGPTTTTGGGPSSCVMLGGDMECDPMAGECGGAGSACDIANAEGTMDYGTSCFPAPNDAGLGGACDNQNGPYCEAGLACSGGTCSEYCCGDGDCPSGTCAIGSQEWSTTTGLTGIGVCQ